MVGMAGWNEEDHPRDGGKFTSKGGSAHVGNAERQVAATHRKLGAERRIKAASSRSAAKAHRLAAERAKDPAEKSEHLVRAAHHDERAAHHEGVARAHEENAKEQRGSGLAKWAAGKLDKLKEGVRGAGEKATKVEEQALTEGGIETGAVEGMKALAGGAAGAAGKAAGSALPSEAEHRHGHKE
jgi:hypothetical protein